MTFDDIQDIAVDENFEIYIGSTGDLAVVKGRDAFEQELIIRLTERMRNLVGETNVDKETITKLAQTYSRRVAASMDELDSIATFQAEFSDQEVDTLEVEIVYDTGEILEFDIQS